jgi:hypothetical protein
VDDGVRQGSAKAMPSSGRLIASLSDKKARLEWLRVEMHFEWHRLRRSAAKLSKQAVSACAPGQGEPSGTDRRE